MLSLLLHALLGLGWARWSAVTSAPSPRPVAAAPLVFELLERQAPRARPEPPPSAVVPPRLSPPSRPARVPLAQRVPVPLPVPPPGAPAAPTLPDAPQAVRLFPGPQGLPVLPGTAGAGGHTWRPGDGPTAEQRLAEEGERVRGRVQGFVEDDLAVARVEGGIVDPYFSQMRQALEKAMTGAPLFDYQGALRHVLPSGGDSREFERRARRYGATGSPDDVAGGPSGTERLEDVARAGTAGARTRSRPPTALDMLERSGGDAHALDVELELEQSPTGQVLGVKLLRGSGNPLFDRYVLEQVPGALAKLGPASEAFAARTRAPTVRSAWNVRGQVSFARVIQLSKLHTLDAQDAAYVSALLATNLLGGQFDETRGEVTIADLRRPHFDVRTRLLRVY